MSEVTLVRATDAEVLADAPGSLITLLADSDTTGGGFTTNRATLKRGVFGTPAHFHTRATEFFFVLGGTLQVLVREDLHSLGEGISSPCHLGCRTRSARPTTRTPMCWWSSPQGWTGSTTTGCSTGWPEAKPTRRRPESPRGGTTTTTWRARSGERLAPRLGELAQLVQAAWVVSWLVLRMSSP